MDVRNELRKRMSDHNLDPDSPFLQDWLAAGKNFLSVHSVEGTSALAVSFAAVNEFYSALLQRVSEALDSNFRTELQLPNFDLDTNMLSVSGLYEQADETVEQIIARAQQAQKMSCSPTPVSTRFPDYF